MINAFHLFGSYPSCIKYLRYFHRMLTLVIAITVLTLAAEGCLDKYTETDCKTGQAAGRCSEFSFANNCELTCGNCCNISTMEECHLAKARGECYNKLMNRCDKMCGHCVNFWKVCARRFCWDGPDHADARSCSKKLLVSQDPVWQSKFKNTLDFLEYKILGDIEDVHFWRF